MLQLTGYSDRIYCRPGDTIKFMVNCEAGGTYDATMVRIICGDDNPKGPGVKEELIETDANGQYIGREQEIYAGSCAEIPNTHLHTLLKNFTVQTFIWPTTPGRGRQGVVTKWSPDRNAGFALYVNEQGSIAVQIGDGSGKTTSLSTQKRLLERRWYRVGATFEASSRRLVVFQHPLAPVPGIEDGGTMEGLSDVALGVEECPLVFAAFYAGKAARGNTFSDFYNGKIDGPILSDQVLSPSDCEIVGAARRASPGPGLVGAWDFSLEMSTDRVIDRSPNRFHGRTVNFPARAMTGWNWTGEIMDWKQDPAQWGAIHFHDDDIYDAGWEPDFELVVPPNMKSGLYAARLRTATAEEYIPFTVSPAPGRERRIALILPTASYMAYGNDHLGTDGGNGEVLNNILTVLTAPDLFLNEHCEYGGSLYDVHSDGSGICYSSRLRPILNMRPKVQGILGGFGHSRLWQFNADTHITDWLEAMGHEYDVLTDEELHDRGYALLAPYHVVISGTHPEYTSTEMWDALRAWLDRGGRFMYLGGDGFYWRIAYHRERPGIIELRRNESGVRAWAAAPGEYYQGFDGRFGGLWVRQGRAPQALVGVGFAAQGFDLSTYYRRLPDSYKPEVAFIFEGIADDELIGDFGLIAGGAAGLEVDRAAPELGTPPNAFVLASSEGHTDTYYLVPEEFLETSPALGGHENPLVRANMVFFETPNTGAVFSVGSIAWAGSLSTSNYQNNVSRITDNVLRRLLNPQPFRH